MIKITAFSLSVAFALTVGFPRLTANAENASRAMDLTSSELIKAKAFKSASYASGEASASFILSQPEKAKSVTRYADGELSSNCTKGNYSIANRNCTGSDGDAYGKANGVQAAVDASAAGDIVLIRAFSGVYTGRAGGGIALNHRQGTSINSRTTLQGYGTERPKLRGLAGGPEGGGYGYYFFFKNFIVDHGNVFNSGSGGFVYSRLENLEIKNAGEMGLLGIGSSELINLNVHHNGFNSAHCKAAPTQCHGVYTGAHKSNDPKGNFNVFDGGRYHHNEGYGIHCYSTCAKTTFRNLRAHHNRSGGIIVAVGGGSVVHNIVADNNGSATGANVGLFLGSEGTITYHVTAYNNHGGMDIYVPAERADQIIKDSIAIPNGISAPAGTKLSNNITTGRAPSLFQDADNGNFQLVPTSRVKGIGANLSYLRD